MARKKNEPAEDPHDVLAAEEFPPPAGADADTPEARAHRAAQNQGSWADPAHDVLAADEFPPPAGADADTVTARAHRLPPDPLGADEPAHDILAAEEYPPPAHADVVAGDVGSSPSRLPRLAAVVVAALAGYALVRRRRR